MKQRRLTAAVWVLAATVALLVVIVFSGAGRSLPNLGPALNLDRADTAPSPGATVPSATPTSTPSATATPAKTPTATPTATPRPPAARPAPTKRIRVAPAPPVRVPAAPPPANDDDDDDDAPEPDDDDDGADDD